MIRVLGLEMGDHPGLSGWPSVITRHSANKPVLDGCHFVGSGLQLRRAVARAENSSQFTAGRIGRLSTATMIWIWPVVMERKRWITPQPLERSKPKGILFCTPEPSSWGMSHQDCCSS